MQPIIPSAPVRIPSQKNCSLNSFIIFIQFSGSLTKSIDGSVKWDLSVDFTLQVCPSRFGSITASSITNEEELICFFICTFYSRFLCESQTISLALRQLKLPSKNLTSLLLRYLKFVILLSVRQIAFFTSLSAYQRLTNGISFENYYLSSTNGSSLFLASFF